MTDTNDRKIWIKCDYPLSKKFVVLSTISSQGYKEFFVAPLLWCDLEERSVSSPPTSTSKQYENAVKGVIHPEKNWKEIQIHKLFFETDSYEEANYKLDDLVNNKSESAASLKIPDRLRPPSPSSGRKRTRKPNSRFILAVPTEGVFKQGAPLKHKPVRPPRHKSKVHSNSSDSAKPSESNDSESDLEKSSDGSSSEEFPVVSPKIKRKKITTKKPPLLNIVQKTPKTSSHHEKRRVRTPEYPSNILSSHHLISSSGSTPKRTTTLSIPGNSFSSLPTTSFSLSSQNIYDDDSPVPIPSDYYELVQNEIREIRKEIDKSQQQLKDMRGDISSVKEDIGKLMVICKSLATTKKSTESEPVVSEAVCEEIERYLKLKTWDDVLKFDSYLTVRERHKRNLTNYLLSKPVYNTDQYKTFKNVMDTLFDCKSIIQFCTWHGEVKVPNTPERMPLKITETCKIVMDVTEKILLKRNSTGTVPNEIPFGTWGKNWVKNVRDQIRRIEKIATKKRTPKKKDKKQTPKKKKISHHENRSESSDRSKHEHLPKMSKRPIMSSLDGPLPSTDESNASEQVPKSTSVLESPLMELGEQIENNVEEIADMAENLLEDPKDLLGEVANDSASDDASVNREDKSE